MPMRSPATDQARRWRSHCDVLRALVAHYLGLPLDNLLRFEIDAGSVSRVEVGAWGGRVLGVNELGLDEAAAWAASA